MFYFELMFDFEKLLVYKKVRLLNKVLLPFVFSIRSSNPYLSDQLKRASLSIMFNLAEGTGRSSNADKKHFYIISRSSLHECVSIIQCLLDVNRIETTKYNELYLGYEETSMMLLGLIRSVIKK